MPFIETDPQKLMIALAKMAKMDVAPIRRMVLVLDVEDVPRMYVETFLKPGAPDSELPQTEIVVQQVADVQVDEKANVVVGTWDKDILPPVDTTSIQNQQFRTKTPALIFFRKTEAERDG